MADIAVKPSPEPSVKDGFYGWVVVLACFTIRIFIYGMTTTSGILYVVFLDEFNDSKAATAIIGSLISASGFFIGTASGILVNRFGCRSVVIASGILASSGLILSSFARSITHLIISYGVVAGCGFGACYVPCSVLVSQYFNKHRNMALGIAASGGGLGSFLFPIVLRWLISLFGWRGTLLISGGVTLNMCVCGALMRPFIEDPNNNASLTKSQMEISRSLFHWDVFKNKSYIIFMVQHLLFSFGISIVYVHLSAFGKTVGISEDDSAIVFSAMGVVVIASKILTGVVASHPKTDEHVIYILILLLGGAAVCALPAVQNLIWFGGMACTFAITFANLGGCLVPALCTRYCGVARLSTSYGVSLVVDGVGHFIGAPIAGLLYEATDVYANSFYLAGCVVAISGLLMIIPWRMFGPTRQLRLTSIDNGGRLQDVNAENGQEKEPLNDVTNDSQNAQKGQRLKHIPNPMLKKSHLSLYHDSALSLSQVSII